MQDTTLLIKFGRSTSRKYKEALELAARFDDFSEATDGQPENTIRLPAKEWFEKKREFDDLYAFVAHWKGTSVSLDGAEIKPHEFFWKFNTVIKCARDHDEAIDKTHYCSIAGSFEGWGCKQLDNLDRHLSKTGSYAMKYWYMFGEFVSEGVWKIDKGLIKDYLKKEAEEKNLAYCNNFSLEKAWTIVDGLPDEIDARASAWWEVDYREDFEGAAIQRQPVGIRHKTHSGRGRVGVSAMTKDGMLNLEMAEERTRFIPGVTFDDVGGIDDIID